MGHKSNRLLQNDLEWLEIFHSTPHVESQMTADGLTKLKAAVAAFVAESVVMDGFRMYHDGVKTIQVVRPDCFALD
jgi:hypothetical protein